MQQQASRSASASFRRRLFFAAPVPAASSAAAPAAAAAAAAAASLARRCAATAVLRAAAAASSSSSVSVSVAAPAPVAAAAASAASDRRHTHIDSNSNHTQQQPRPHHQRLMSSSSASSSSSSPAAAAAATAAAAAASFALLQLLTPHDFALTSPSPSPSTTTTTTPSSCDGIENRDASGSGLRFDWGPAAIAERAAALEAATVAAFDALAAVPAAQRCWATVGAPLADLEAATALRGSNLGFLMHVHPDAAVREAATAAAVRLEQLDLRMMSRRDVFAAVEGAAAKAAGAAGAAGSGSGSVGPVERRFLDKVLFEFAGNGVSLPDEADRARLQAVKAELTELGTAFSKEIADVDDKIYYKDKSASLKGCEADFLDALEAEKDGEHAGEFAIDTTYPHVFQILDYCEVPETRRAIYMLFNGRAQANGPRLDRAVELRREAAKLLGFDTHVDYRAHDRMAKTSDAIRDFLGDLRARMRPSTAADIAALTGLKRELTGKADAELDPWDVRYYSRLRKERDFALDMQKVKAYFPISSVLTGMLGVYEEMLAVRFRRVENPHVWHPDVQLYAVFNADAESTGAGPIGHFYLDLHPRDGKYGHAAVFGLVSRHRRQSAADAGLGEAMPELTTPVCAMVCNFPKPTESNPDPTLSFSDVVTVFHEFGHVVHQVLTTADIARFAGTSVERDFVEAPSQMLENFCYDKTVLARLTKEPMPDDVADALRRSRKANIGFLTSRQLFFATFDWTLHSSAETVDTTKLWVDLSKEITLMDVPSTFNAASSFGHLFGYDAGYYSYLWSEAFSCAMFAKFEAEAEASGKPIVNPELGARYREHILGPGLTHDSMVGLTAFLGAPPTNDAFLKHLGVDPDAKL